MSPTADTLMPRQAKAHGTYRAWQRCRERPGGACALCMQAREDRNARVAGRSVERVLQREAQVDAAAAASRTPRSRLLRCVVDLAEFVRDGYLYGAIDLLGEMDELLDEWCAEVVGPGDENGTPRERAWAMGEVWGV